MGINEREGVCYMQPTTLEERQNVASAFIRDSSYRIPLVVDGMDDAADEAFAGWPERLYIVSQDGRIAYKGRTGPFGFEPDEVEAWLESHLQ